MTESAKLDKTCMELAALSVATVVISEAEFSNCRKIVRKVTLSMESSDNVLVGITYL